MVCNVQPVSELDQLTYSNSKLKNISFLINNMNFIISMRSNENVIEISKTIS